MAERSEEVTTSAPMPANQPASLGAVAEAAAEAVDALVRRGRYIQAQALLDASPAPETLAGSKEKLDMIYERSRTVQEAVSTTEGLDWTFGADVGGVVARYRSEPDDSVSFTIAGPVVAPAFELFCAMSDFERYAAWFPLCNLSKIHHKIDTYDNVIQASMSTPFLARDTVVRTWGADCLQESMTFMVIGKSLEATSEVSAPPMEGVFIDRAVVRKLVMRFEVVTPMSVKLYICCNIDMKLSLPTWMIAFFVNNMLSIVPQNMAKYAMQIKDSPTDKASVFIQQQMYYRDVALPAARALFASRGWTYFPEVPEEAPEAKDAPPPMVKSGLLWKRGQGVIVKPWAHRQFLVSVESAHMEYYSEKGERKGAVDLQGVEASITPKESLSLDKSFGPNATAFLLKYPSQQKDRNKMLLVAETYDDAIEWIRIINRASANTFAKNSVNLPKERVLSSSRTLSGSCPDSQTMEMLSTLAAAEATKEGSGYAESASEPIDDDTAAFSFKPKKPRASSASVAASPAPANTTSVSAATTTSSVSNKSVPTVKPNALRVMIEEGMTELIQAYGFLLAFPLLVFLAPPMLQPLLFLAIIYGALVMYHFGIPLPLDLDLFIMKSKKQ